MADKKVTPEATEVIPLNDNGDGAIVETKPKRVRPSRAKPKAAEVSKES